MRFLSRRVSLILLVLVWAVPAQSRPPVAEKLTILLSNDDGYNAPGLQALIDALEPVSDLYVAAPADNQSGKGHSITMGKPLYVQEENRPNGRIYYAINATPATCVRLGLEKLMPRKPDLVVSGINRGENLGLIVYYSGTLGAAREAAMSGLPSIAVSMGGNDKKDYAATADYVRELIQQLQERRLIRHGFFLNVNVPAGSHKGVRVTRLAMTAGKSTYERRTDKDGRPYFWQNWQPPADGSEGTDVWAFVRGYITITPLALDETAPKELDLFRPLERVTAMGAAAR
ncbi:MAG: 5'/3'-nucleotidase SurE [Deltaproteobacteria bacterium]